MNITIRTAKYEDAGSIAALGQCVWIDTYATEGVTEALSKYVISHFAPDRIRDLLAAKKVLVAEMDGHLVGYAVLSIGIDSTEIDNLYVLPKFQHRGVGKKIIAHISMDHSHLWLSCWERNRSAIGFYASMGFVEDGESFFDLDGELYRNVILTRNT